MIKNNIPSWLFFGLYQGKWTDEKQKTAESILKSLKQKAEFEHWNPQILEKVLYVNKFDDSKMYGSNSIEKLSTEKK